MHESHVQHPKPAHRSARADELSYAAFDASQLDDDHPTLPRPAHRQPVTVSSALEPVQT